jgi:hypothetical protein
MWLRNTRTEEIGWHHPNEKDIKSLLVYIRKSTIWITAFWAAEETECVDDEEVDYAPPF